MLLIGEQSCQVIDVRKRIGANTKGDKDSYATCNPCVGDGLLVSFGTQLIGDDNGRSHAQAKRKGESNT